MSSIHGKLYNLILAQVYRRYGFPNAEMNISGRGRDGDGTAAVGHGMAGVGGHSRTGTYRGKQSVMGGGRVDR